YLRTSWDKDATLLAFRCGPIGNGHGHVDLLHLDLFAGGEDILTDSGRLTYVNNEKRLYLKSQFAHNTVTVDGKPFSDCVASWQYGKVAHPLKGQVFEDAQYYYVSGGHLGYLVEGVFVRRQIVCLKPDIVIIFDSFYTGGAHSYTQKFHFGGNGSLTLRGQQAEWQSNNNRAVLVALGEQPHLRQEQTILSHRYNQESSAPCVEITYQFPATAGVLTVIGVNPQPDFSAQAIPVVQAREQRVLSGETAQGLRIVNGGERHTLIFSLNDPVGGINLLEADGCIGYGEVMVFDKNQKRTVLAN
ncbi:MAG: heparinase II/III-family protein, partial [Angelakisella sp.]